MFSRPLVREFGGWEMRKYLQTIAVCMIGALPLSAAGQSAQQQGIETAAYCTEGQSPDACVKAKERLEAMEKLEVECRHLLEKPPSDALAARELRVCSQFGAQLALHPEFKTADRLELTRRYEQKVTDRLEASCAAAVEAAGDGKLPDNGRVACMRLSQEIGRRPELSSPSKQEVLRQAAVKVAAQALGGPKGAAAQSAEQAAGSALGKCKAACAEPERACAAGKPTDAACFRTAACMCNCMAENIPADHPERAKMRACAADATTAVNRLQSSGSN